MIPGNAKFLVRFSQHSRHGGERLEYLQLSASKRLMHCSKEQALFDILVGARK